MSNSNSQEQTIYRSLAGQIQLGFFDDGERFPSAQEIARGYQVSYCPAQRSLKALERDGYVSLCRGKETVVLAKPYQNFLESAVFLSRAEALIDLKESLKLLSPTIYFHGLCHLRKDAHQAFLSGETGHTHAGKRLYRSFGHTLKALGSQTVLSLYYDIGAFAESAFLDALYALHEKKEADSFLRGLTEDFWRSHQDCLEHRYARAKQRLEALAAQFYGELGRYFQQIPRGGAAAPEPFSWTPHKGRTRYCDVVAIDLVCKIHRGLYPVGTFLPNIADLADTYHVSPITVRRTMDLLNKLGVARTINGVGTKVIFAGDTSILYKLKDLTLDDNLRIFLEALQLFTIISEPICEYSMPFFNQESFDEIYRSLAMPKQKSSLVATFGAVIQAVIRCCPLAAIREIYEKMIFFLLKGSVLRLGETGDEPVDYWPTGSAALRDALDARDGARFAAAFHSLCVNNFVATKQGLMKLGVAGVERIAVPIPPGME